MKKTITIIIAVILVIGGGFYFSKYIFTSDPITGDWKDPSLGWPLYQNKQLGFEINYPPSCSEAETLSQNIVNFSCEGKDPTLKDRVSVRKLDVPAGENYQKVIMENTVFDASGMNPEFWSEFKETKIGDNTFYKIRTGRFEADLSYSYYLVWGNMVYDFAFLSHGVVDWTDPNLDEEADSTHVILKQMLQTLKFTK